MRAEIHSRVCLGQFAAMCAQRVPTAAGGRFGTHDVHPLLVRVVAGVLLAGVGAQDVLAEVGGHGGGRKEVEDADLRGRDGELGLYRILGVSAVPRW
jgi:hypothetical protein